MFRVHQGATVVGSAVLAVALAAAVASCGDDNGSAQATTAEFCVEASQQLSGGDEDAGPYSQFYDKHPEPMLADWATDGHLVTDNVQATIDQIESLHPSDEAQPFVDDVLAAMNTVKANAEAIEQAGKDNDQAAFDQLEKVNQDTNIPTLMSTMEAITEMCQTTSGS